MTKMKYSKKQLEKLSKNIHIKSCTQRYITYTDDFKIKAIKLYNDWLYPKRIFRDFGFPDFVVETEAPKWALKRWRKKIKEWWFTNLVSSKKWRKKKDNLDISKMNKDEYIEYLEAKVAYQNELHKKICDSAYP